MTWNTVSFECHSEQLENLHQIQANMQGNIHLDHMIQKMAVKVAVADKSAISGLWQALINESQWRLLELAMRLCHLLQTTTLPLRNTSWPTVVLRGNGNLNYETPFCHATWVYHHKLKVVWFTNLWIWICVEIIHHQMEIKNKCLDWSSYRTHKWVTWRIDPYAYGSYP